MLQERSELGEFFKDLNQITEELHLSEVSQFLETFLKIIKNKNNKKP